jgi:hypothetical protein
MKIEVSEDRTMRRRHEGGPTQRKSIRGMRRIHAGSALVSHGTGRVNLLITAVSGRLEPLSDSKFRRRLSLMRRASLVHNDYSSGPQVIYGNEYR